jgi:hypothetical protein
MTWRARRSPSMRSIATGERPSIMGVGAGAAGTSGIHLASGAAPPESTMAAAQPFHNLDLERPSRHSRPDPGTSPRPSRKLVHNLNKGRTGMADMSALCNNCA